MCSSDLDFTEQRFRPVLPDPGVRGGQLDDAAVRRVLLCSGKVSYELLSQRENQGSTDTAVLRVEQRELVARAFAAR